MPTLRPSPPARAASPAVERVTPEPYQPPTVVYVREKMETKPRITVARRNPEAQAVVTELQETVGKSGGQVLRKAEPRPVVTVQLTENSTPDEVSTWLQEKGFSIRVIELLEGQDGANLFALNKTSLMQACGREEGSRLYSQLLVQKKQSNYRTYSSAELKAILNYRRKHVEITNEAPGNEPATVPE
ncbi:hypothetical protein Aduo_013532 [Ancylostoma duodenale]